MSNIGENPHEALTFEDFRKLATNPKLSRHEKVGFPISYREGKEEKIFKDICAKLCNLSIRGQSIVEIGPGCSEIPEMIAQLCKENANHLFYVDSEEMLEQLPQGDHITKCMGKFPDDMYGRIEKWRGNIDVIIAYSVIQYVFTAGNLWKFVDCCLSILSDGGEILFGDVPNVTMRKRFFASSAGEETHYQYTGRKEKPEVTFNALDPDQMDDSVIMSILMRARAQGYHAWVVPQSSSLPMANRREDILIRKP